MRIAKSETNSKSKIRNQKTYTVAFCFSFETMAASPGKATALLRGERTGGRSTGGGRAAEQLTAFVVSSCRLAFVSDFEFRIEHSCCLSG
jgi:hypothetical protein